MSHDSHTGSTNRNPARAAHLMGDTVAGEKSPPRIDEAGTKPRLPHERDEASDEQHVATPSQQDQGKQAYADATSGQIDTGRSPVTDQIYEEKVRTGSTPMRD